MPVQPLVSLVVVLAALVACPAHARTTGAEDLLSVYATARPILNDPDQDSPFYLQANVKKNKQAGEAAVYFEMPFGEIADSLSVGSNWCSILILHLNIKACTYSRQADGDESLTVYLGRKFYQEPDDAFVMTYEFQTDRQENYFSALITAEKGPLGTSDYRIQLEVTDIDGRTFGRFQVSQKHSWISSRAAKLYLSTVGRGKHGISVVDTDDNGEPIYSTGERAVAERNLLRYYFAFTAFFQNKDTGGADDFRNRLNHWFDQTEQYKQLYELDRKQYVSDKGKEFQNQVALQNSQYVDKETYKK